MPPMVTLVDIVGQLEELDVKLVALIEERVRLCNQAGGLDGDQETELFSAWLEESAEKGLDEDKMEKVGRLLAALSRQSLDDE